MRILEYIVRKKVLVGLLSVLIIALGGLAVLQLDKEIMPSVGMDGAYVNVDAGELSAIDVERTITTPLEQKIQAIEGVQEIQSKTQRGDSTLQITFDRGQGEKLSKEVHQVAALRPLLRNQTLSSYLRRSHPYRTRSLGSHHTDLKRFLLSQDEWLLVQLRLDGLLWIILLPVRGQM